MGQALVRCIRASDQLTLAGVWARSDAGGIVIRPDLDALLDEADVAVDFTLPAALPVVLESVGRTGKPLVCGVTGLDHEGMRRIAATARSIPLLYDRNMSVGIAVLAELVAQAAAALDFAASIHETHHVHKKDAPSGTALKLAEALARARAQAFDDVYRFDTDGNVRRRSADEILVTAERRGEVAGEHRVRFDSGAESLVLEHAVSDRRVFATGALLAARWLASQGPGLYAMRDVVQAGVAGGHERRDSVE